MTVLERLTLDDMALAVAAQFVARAGEWEGIDHAKLARGNEILKSWTLTYGERFPFGCEPLDSEYPAEAVCRIIIDAGYIATAAQRRAVYFTPKSADKIGGGK